MILVVEKASGVNSLDSGAVLKHQLLQLQGLTLFLHGLSSSCGAEVETGGLNLVVWLAGSGSPLYV